MRLTESLVHLQTYKIKDGCSLVIRKAYLSDLDGIMNSLEAVSKEGRWVATEEVTHEQRERYRKRLTSEDQLHLCRIVDERVVGILDLTPYRGIKRAKHVAGLGMLLLEEYRGLGIGSGLMEAALSWAPEHGFVKISLSVFSNNEAAIRLYQKFGFLEEGRLKQQFKIMDEYVDEVLMGKWLEAMNQD